MCISIVSSFAVLSLIVLVHELGHFLVARSVGVKVYEFSVGFPFSPRLLTLFRHKETEFTLRLLPLGGFVRFSRGGDEGAGDLFGASYRERALIVSAGPLCNIVFAFLVFVCVFAAEKHLSFTDALLWGGRTLWIILSGTAGVIFDFLTGNGSLHALSGPVGIAALAAKAASKGMSSLLYFTGLLSMSLGVMNLIPLPALDGGQLFLLIIEAFRKRPLSLKTYQVVNMIGLSLFLILAAVVTYRDVVKLVA